MSDKGIKLFRNQNSTFPFLVLESSYPSLLCKLEQRFTSEKVLYSFRKLLLILPEDKSAKILRKIFSETQY